MHSALWIGFEIIIKLYGRLFADIKNSNFLNLGSGPFQVGSRWRRCNGSYLAVFFIKVPIPWIAVMETNAKE